MNGNFGEENTKNTCFTFRLSTTFFTCFHNQLRVCEVTSLYVDTFRNRLKTFPCDMQQYTLAHFANLRYIGLSVFNKKIMKTRSAWQSQTWGRPAPQVRVESPFRYSKFLSQQWQLANDSKKLYHILSQNFKPNCTFSRLTFLGDPLPRWGVRQQDLVIL